MQLDPLSAEAQSNLGEMLLEVGRPTEALEHCRQAVGLRADSARPCQPRQRPARLRDGSMRLRLAFARPSQGSPILAAPHAALAGLLERAWRL